MRYKWWIPVAVTFSLLAIALLNWWYPARNGDDDMIVSCARNYSGFTDVDYQYGEYEYNEKVLPRWGFPLPEGLLMIGGIDHVSWAKICRDDSDPEGIFRGEVLDHGVHYIGRFRYEHREGKPLPENVFRDYYMASLSHADVGFSQDGRPPVDFFRLIAIDPDGYRQPIANE